MATLPELKKKLKSIRSTEKITKAMKTVAAAKYSSLNRIYSGYGEYAAQCTLLFEKYSSNTDSFFPVKNPEAPPLLLIFASNKGMCGGFNTEILNFTRKKMQELPENTVFIACGRKAVSFFQDKNISVEKSYAFPDIPDSACTEELLSYILEMRDKGSCSEVFAIYPRYFNVIRQTPVMVSLFPASAEKQTEENPVLFVPDKKTVAESLAMRSVFTRLHSVILETALGAQAATLTTMRSAYDTASQYSALLEIQINRKRQSEVTSDVIESRQTEA